jgi:hypothetical protein
MKLRLPAAMRGGGERVDKISVIAGILQQRVFVIQLLAITRNGMVPVVFLNPASTEKQRRGISKSRSKGWAYYYTYNHT